jgi:hypothetical protein
MQIFGPQASGVRHLPGENVAHQLAELDGIAGAFEALGHGANIP